MAEFEWIQSVDSPFTSFSVRVPARSANVTITPAPTYAPDQGANGELLYSGDPMPLKPGAKQVVSFAYTSVATSPTAGGTGGSTPVVFGLVLAIVVLLVVLVIMIARQRRASEE